MPEPDPLPAPAPRAAEGAAHANGRPDTPRPVPTLPDHPRPGHPRPARPRRAGPDDVNAVRALLTRARHADGIDPLSERFRMRLGEATAAVVPARGGECAAYGAVLDDGTVELVVDPGRRRRGIGSALLTHLVANGEVRTIWAHGDLTPAHAFAARHGLRRLRTLHLLSRPLGPTDAGADVAFPTGYTLRPFRPGEEDAWLGVNAAAFARHPEQGRVDRRALDALMREPWFDPADLLLLWGPEGDLAGSHWTKIDPGATVPGPDGPVPTGEVYVLAVAPAHQGRGLSGPLTRAGMTHLARRGLPAVILYVDADNAPAMATYRRLGFASISADTQYALP